MEQQTPNPVFDDNPMPFEPFVLLSRRAVVTMKVHQFCRLRRCARDGMCRGKLKRRVIPPAFCQAPDFVAWLPLCLAGADDGWLELFIIYWHACWDDHFSIPIDPPRAAPERRPLHIQWPHADFCAPETLPPLLNPGNGSPAPSSSRS